MKASWFLLIAVVSRQALGDVTFSEVEMPLSGDRVVDFSIAPSGEVIAIASDVSVVLLEADSLVGIGTIRIPMDTSGNLTTQTIPSSASIAR